MVGPAALACPPVVRAFPHPGCEQIDAPNGANAEVAAFSEKGTIIVRGQVTPLPESPNDVCCAHVVKYFTANLLQCRK